MENRGIAFSRLVDLLDTLRGPQGCPWDKEQTHDSLKRYLLEESHEVFEVIDHSPEKLPEELGDVLLQVLFHAQIAAEEGRFTIDDVLESLRDKLVRRHPHVFGEQKVRDAREVEANWEELKRGERDRPAGRIAAGQCTAGYARARPQPACPGARRPLRLRLEADRRCAGQSRRGGPGDPGSAVQEERAI